MANQTDYQTTWGGKPVKMSPRGTPSWIEENLGEDNPLPWQQYYDKGVADSSNPDSLVGKQLGRGKEYFQDQLNAGINDTVNPMNPTPLTGGEAPNPMVDAISRKYQRGMNRNLQALQTKNADQSDIDYGNSLSQANRVLMGSQQNKNQNFLQQYDFQMKRWNLQQQHNAAMQAGKAQFLGNIIGVGVGVASAGMRG